ncbi:hypothetical protein PVL29_011308 [Vitis rotundifolia]|uniref:non-specific serine/threonine protein kinase n=1 Tax=Vitis rotundifolia TaxID=103349 RepID=A0AA39DQ90_VITRO|nr:hypothetical protein PVL29_011308 [Vitis rotundifolia]
MSDSEFIDTGINYDVSMEHSSRFGTPDQQLMTVRSFPEGTKNCYTLQPQQGKDNKYLIRASFMYGNYDSKNQLPEFKLYLGVNEWDTVKFNHSYDIVRKEIIHVLRTGRIDVCLVNTGSGSPFISALELRQLNNSIYTTQSGSLILFKRLDIGSTSQRVRYKDDTFDRVWEPFCQPYWKSVSASYSSDSLSDNHFKPPSKVMATAVTPADERYPLEFHWNLDNSTRQFYVYMHFAEVEELQSNQLRELYVSLNGWFWSPEPIVPGKLVPHTGFSTHSISASSELSLSIFKTRRSTLPPILNALEIYEIKQLFQLSTVQSNVDAIKKIKAVYKVKKNWQGDPCLPIEFSWNGLNCSDNSPISPSIVSLNLSGSKLTGKIDSSFSRLTSLKSLDLSYNSLTGEVPNFLSKLPSLKTLNLSGNNLTGSVPLVLIEKSRNRSLSLRLDGNPNLCKKNSCEEEEDKEKTSYNVIVPLVASIISVLVLLLGEVAASWIFKRRQQHGGMTLDSMNPRLSYSEVNRITGNFKKLLDQGASAKVYLGRLSDGTEVAVKMLTPSSVLVFKQFKTEARLLTRIHHKNLVSLIGYCDEGSRMVLIYEHMAKGNLKEYLSGKKEIVLSWEQRLRIAIDVAQALEYLHDGCNPPIIHRDVKTENILLNEKFQAKVAAFGWSRSMSSEGGSYVSTAIVGTPGYIVPDTNSYEEAKEKEEKNIVVPADASITLFVVPSDIVVKPNEDDKTFEPKNQHLTYFEVERITDNFEKELGRGASAIVYHGHLSNGTEVAVKKLSPSSILGSKQFKTEAQLLTRVHHKNLVSLIGYCDEGSNMVLIYEYMAKGNVKAYLSGKTEVVLSWEQRLRIAIDAAQALEYLHNGCNPPIIHRDVKTENILLNEKLQAKVADFGWSKSMPAEGGSYVFTAIVGTPGYLDPEYHRSSVPNEKTDVYSFGIVLLELISGRPAIIKITKENLCNITNWVRPIIAKGDIRMIVDPRLKGEFETNSARRTIETAMSCVSFSSTERPTMSDIVVELRECLKIAMANERTNNLEEDHDSAGTEAAMTAEESLDGNPNFHKTDSYEKAKEKEKEEKRKEKKKNFIGPAFRSITSVLDPSGALNNLGRSKKKLPHAKDMSYSKVARITYEVGYGASGPVYLGHFRNGIEVAVKKLSALNRGFREFQTEAELLTRVHHTNLVSLLGYHFEGSSMTLIYEYMGPGSLRKYLSDENEAVLSWKQRIGIALDLAQGLEYLHNGCKAPIIHRDIKSANILLNEKNEKLQAKVADFGLSRSVPNEDPACLSTVVVGTCHYLDPKYFLTAGLSEENDVYGFGIVLLELIPGQPAVAKSSAGTVHLLQWVPLLLLDTGEITAIVDPRLNIERFDIYSARKLVRTAMACVKRNPPERPIMSDVADKLKQCMSYLARTIGDAEK